MQSKGFVGLDVDTVFPQFSTCYNVTAENIYSQLVSGNNDRVVGEWSQEDPAMEGTAVMNAGQGGGVIFLIQPGNFYYIATGPDMCVWLRSCSLEYFRKDER